MAGGWCEWLGSWGQLGAFGRGQNQSTRTLILSLFWRAMWDHFEGTLWLWGPSGLGAILRPSMAISKLALAIFPTFDAAFEPCWGFLTEP